MPPSQQYRSVSILLLFVLALFSSSPAHSQQQRPTRAQSLNLDATIYNVRALNYAVPPAVPGITAECTKGSPQVTISAPANFANGDGVALLGCGPSISIPAPPPPTVTNAVAAAPTNTGYVVPGPAGSHTDCYIIVARNIAQGISAASPEACTRTAQKLGAEAGAIAKCARSTTTQLTTCDAPNTLAAGAMVQLTGTSNDQQFGGWETVTSATPTTFTFKDGRNTHAGAATSSTGGTAYWWNSNHLALPAPKNGAWQYAIYTGAAHEEKLCNVSMPDVPHLSEDPTFMVWDDYGVTMSCDPKLPSFWPKTPPLAPAANTLVTTIASGAGTTTLTLAAPVSTSQSSATILFDNVPNIENAMRAAIKLGTYLHFPATQSGFAYVLNSYSELSGNISIAGFLWLNDTMQFHGKLTGELSPSSAGLCPQFCISSNNAIVDERANPGLYINGSAKITGIAFTQAGGSNGYNTVFAGPGAIPSYVFENVSFSSGGKQDLSGVHYIQFAQHSAGGAAGTMFKNIQLASGPGQIPGLTATPQFITKNFGEIAFDGVILNTRGLFFNPNEAGLDVDFNMRYEMQGPIMPMLTTYSQNGPAQVFTIHHTIMDSNTETTPTVTNLGADSNINLRAEGVGYVGTTLVSGIPFGAISVDNSISGLSAIGQNISLHIAANGSPWDGFYHGFGVTNGDWINSSYQAQHAAMGPGMSFFTSAAPPAAPTCTNGSAGPPAPAAGTYKLYYVARYPDGGTGPWSAIGTCTADGAHKLNIHATAVPGATGYLYANTNNNIISTAVDAVTKTDWAGNYLSGGAIPKAPGSGPTKIRDGQIWTQHLTVATGTNAYAGTATLSNGEAIIKTTTIQSSSHVVLTLQNCSSCGSIYLGPIENSKSFQIKSTNPNDSSTVYWEIR
jgi:hypothetical protein